MDVIGERLHVGELAVRVDVALRVALPLPSVVDVYVNVARIPHAVTRHRIGDTADRRVVDAIGELVPTVPPHGRRPREAIVADGVQRRRLDSWGQGSLAFRDTVRHQAGDDA